MPRNDVIICLAMTDGGFLRRIVRVVSMEKRDCFVPRKDRWEVPRNDGRDVPCNDRWDDLFCDL